MKQVIFLFLISCSFIPLNTGAQNRTLYKVLELQMPKNAGDDFCGTRGASVCWNPVTKKYYAAFAGNKGFPLGVFDSKGMRLSNDDLTTMIDMRGLWYNPSGKKICGNGYLENGWFSYTLDNNGIPTDVTVDNAGMNQPDANSVGTINPKENEILFYYKERVSFYINNILSDRTVTLQLGRKKSEASTGDQDAMDSSIYNRTSVIYTGIKGSELGVLNYTKRQIELYDYATGLPGMTLSLPADCPSAEEGNAAFNFAYANGIYWLFDIEGRRWLGYK